MDIQEIPDVSDILRRGLEAYGLTGRAGPCAVQGMSRYCRMLLDKNREMNLTAITDPVDAANLHMLDCAALLDCADFEHKSLIDVGTGAGFPGMVLKMLVPSLDVTLLDSLNKRLDWLTETCGALGLEGVRTVHARAEERSHDPAFREGFDAVTSRAVAELRTLCELCLGYVRPGGVLLAMKSVDSGGELAAAETAIETLGGAVESVRDYEIPGTDVRLSLIHISEPTRPY